MRKLKGLLLVAFMALAMMSFTSLEDSAECEQQASEAVEWAADQGAYADLGFFEALDEAEADFNWWYDECEKACTVCNSPNTFLGQ